MSDEKTKWNERNAPSVGGRRNCKWYVQFSSQVIMWDKNVDRALFCFFLSFADVLKLAE